MCVCAHLWRDDECRTGKHTRNSVYQGLVCLCVCRGEGSQDRFSKNTVDSWSTLSGAQWP